MDDVVAQLAQYLGIGGGGGGLGALLMAWKTKEEVTQTREDLANYKTHVAENYARSEDVKNLGDRLEKHLTRIEDKLDKKADK